MGEAGIRKERKPFLRVEWWPHRQTEEETGWGGVGLRERGGAAKLSVKRVEFEVLGLQGEVVSRELDMPGWQPSLCRVFM